MNTKYNTFTDNAFVTTHDTNYVNAASKNSTVGKVIILIINNNHIQNPDEIQLKRHLFAE